MNKFISNSWRWCVIVAAIFLPARSWAATSLTLGSASGQAGTTVNVPMTFSPGTDAVSALQFDLTVPVALSTVSVTAGPILTAAAKSISTSLISGRWRFVIFGFNQNAIGSGNLLTIQLGIIPGTPAGDITLLLSNVAYSDPNGNGVGVGTVTNGLVTVLPQAPVLTSAGTATGQVGSPFTYQITATNSPTSYAASGLPAGLTINAATGLISGTPTTAAVSNITLSATNAGGTGTRILTLTVNPASPAITSAGTATGQTGVAFSYQITATNSPTSYAASGLPAGLSLNPVTGRITGTPVASGDTTITVSATNAGGTGSLTVVLTVYSACDLNWDQATNSLDAQLMINEALALAACTHDLNRDGLCDIVDVQRVINDSIGLGCSLTP